MHHNTQSSVWWYYKNRIKNLEKAINLNILHYYRYDDDDNYFDECNIIDTVTLLEKG